MYSVHFVLCVLLNCKPLTTWLLSLVSFLSALNIYDLCKPICTSTKLASALAANHIIIFNYQ